MYWRLIGGQHPPNSVWWRWTAPTSAAVAVQVCSLGPGLSPSNTTVGVYEGDALASLQHVGSSASGFSSPRCPEGHASDRVAFFALAGHRYSLEVDSAAPGGQFRLEIVTAGSLTRRTVRVRGEQRARVVYRTAPNEPNEASFALDWDPSDEVFFAMPLAPYPPVSFWVESSNVSPGPGCPASGRQVAIECPIRPGLKAAGPLITLGGGNDSVAVDYSRPGTIVMGGAGDDMINAGGRVNGGPGDDLITARLWGQSWITGGPGNDSIAGSARSNAIDPGPGIDSVSAGGGRDVIRTRDGDIDYVSCEGTAYIDGLDEAECPRVRRRGAARAIPYEDPGDAGDETPGTSAIDPDPGFIWVSCPRDAPRVCAGTVTASRRDRVFLRLPFRINRSDPKSGDIKAVGFQVSQRKLRAMEGKVRLTVRSRDRAGKLKTASGLYDVTLYGMNSAGRFPLSRRGVLNRKIGRLSRRTGIGRHYRAGTRREITGRQLWQACPRSLAFSLPS